MELPLYTADAFTARPFRGNPAAVCLLKEALPEETMRAVAAEMNLSETAFVRPLDGTPEKATRFSLRWFTPEAEVPLCGHATLATAAVLFREAGSAAAELAFETKSGVLKAAREGGSIRLDFPAESFRPAAVAPAVLEALGAGVPVAVSYARMDRNLLLHLGSAREVRRLAPDFGALRKAKGRAPYLGVIVTAAGDRGYDCVSRYFAPWVGIDEDPVTGSAHCALAPYWARLLGKTELRAFQASRRGGELRLRLKGGRVELLGEAVVVTSGTLRL